MKKAKRRPLKTVKKILLGLLIACAVLAVAVLALNGYVMLSSEGMIISAEEAADYNADCILVLGASVLPGGRPSLMLRDRLLCGIALFESGASDRLLVSGDHGQAEYDEVNAMKDFAVAAGVPSSCIFMDHAGFSTYESMYRARDVFAVKRVIVVSQKYHLFRALYVAKALGLEAVGVPAEDILYVGQTYRELREIAARCKDFLYCIIKPLPAFLGDVIPVSGNGNATNDR